MNEINSGFTEDHMNGINAGFTEEHGNETNSGFTEDHMNEINSGFTEEHRNETNAEFTEARPDRTALTIRLCRPQVPEQHASALCRCSDNESTNNRHLAVIFAIEERHCALPHQSWSFAENSQSIVKGLETVLQ